MLPPSRARAAWPRSGSWTPTGWTPPPCWPCSAPWGVVWAACWWWGANRPTPMKGWASPTRWRPRWTRPSVSCGISSARTTRTTTREGRPEDDRSSVEECGAAGGGGRRGAVATRHRPLPEDPRDVAGAGLPDRARALPGVDRGSLEPPSHPRGGPRAGGIHRSRGDRRPARPQRRAEDQPAAAGGEPQVGEVDGGRGDDASHRRPPVP